MHIHFTLFADGMFFLSFSAMRFQLKVGYYVDVYGPQLSEKN